MKIWRYRHKSDSALKIDLLNAQSAELVGKLLVRSGVDQQWSLKEVSIDLEDIAGDSTPPPGSSLFRGVARVVQAFAKTADRLDRIVSKELADERRAETRYSTQFEISVSSGGKVHKTYCSNISRGGLLLKHELPASFEGKECVLSIASPILEGESLEIKGKVLGSQKDRRRIRFHDWDENVLERIDGWVALLVEQGRGTSIKPSL